MDLQKIQRSLVKEIKYYEDSFQRNKSKPNCHFFKKQARILRRKLASLMDSDYLVIDGTYLVRQHHEHYSTVAFYTRQSFEKFEEYNKRHKLDWIT